MLFYLKENHADICIFVHDSYQPLCSSLVINEKLIQFNEEDVEKIIDFPRDASDVLFSDKSIFSDVEESMWGHYEAVEY